MNNKHPIVIVDDDEDDRFIFREGFLQAGCQKEFLQFSTGVKLMEYLSTTVRSELPSIILLDLNLPGVSGLEILQKIKQTPDWKHIPVIVLTTSSFPNDREACYMNGASCFISKPDAYEDVLKIANGIALLWCLYS